MYKIRHAILADYIAIGDRAKPTVVGLFDYFFIAPDQLGKRIDLAFFSFMQIECSHVHGSLHEVAARWIDPDGRELEIHHPKLNVNFRQSAPGEPLSGKVLVLWTEMMFTQLGTHTLEILVDGARVDGGPELKVVPIVTIPRL